MYFNIFAVFSVVLTLLLLIVFGLLQWLHLPAGSFLDWVIGGATFWWLLVITTVPWNIYFQAKEVLAEGEQSQEKDIAVDEEKVKYVKSLAKRSLLIALILHLLSAIGLYSLAIAGISSVGYIGSGAALLLTVLRPAVRAYEYIAARLAMVRQEFKYPRQDVMELRDRVIVLEENLASIEYQFNFEEPSSFVSAQKRQLEATQNNLTQVAASLEELKATNQAQHNKLAQDAQNAIGRLSADSEFLSHAREIIRFFKEA